MNNGEYNGGENGGFEEKEELIGVFEPTVDLGREKNNFSKLGFGISFFILVIMLSSLIIDLVVYNVFPDIYYSNLYINLLSPICIYGFGLPVLLLLIGKMSKKAPEKQKMKFGSWMLILLVCFGLMYIGANLGNQMMDNISRYFGNEYGNPVESMIDYSNLWITAIFVVIIAPIGEELIFRKLIIDRTAQYGSFVSIMLSALIFGLMHSNFSQFFYAFALGIVFGYVYYNTGNVFLTMALHAAVNFVGSIVTSFLQMGLNDLITDLNAANGMDLDVILEHGFVILSVLLYDVFVYGTMACAIVLPIVLRKRIVLKKGEVALPRGKALSTVISNAGMITMIVFFGLRFLLSILPA